MINIVIPMAGLGSRFIQEGYDTPKPFINVFGKPMILHVLDNMFIDDARFIIVGRKEHLDKEKKLVNFISSKYEVIFIEAEKLTEGTACTVLYAHKYINSDVPLVIANSDQIIDIKISDYLNDCFHRELDGSILTFTDPSGNLNWSYAKTDDDGFVMKVKEKQPISKYASAGIYLYAKGKYFVESAIDMIVEQNKVNNEYYTCPTYNYLIQNNLKIGIYNINYSQMHSLGTPSELEYYLDNR